MKPVRMAKAFLLLFAFSLFWMRDPLVISGLAAIPADFVFLFAALLLAIALLSGVARLKWDPGFWPLLFYFAALATSVLFAFDPRASAFKLATQAYLLGIPVIVRHLVETWKDFRRLLLAYLAGGAVVGVIGVGTLLLFPIFGHHSLLVWPLHHFGTLPPGPYPRLQITFEYPAMMANYLALALMLLLLARARAWVSWPLAGIAGASMLLTAFFALTPGFGGLLFMIAAWFWNRDRRALSSRLFLSGGIAAGVLGALVASATPILHPTAPFLIAIPDVPIPLAPAVRLLAWIDAARTFVAHPLFGIGIGGESVHVPYVNPSGQFTVVTDAHNMPLSIAAQAGIIGLAGMAAILWFVWQEMWRGRDLVFGLSLAFLSGIAVQGLVGSFEDARHLWLAYGLILAARRLEHAAHAAAGSVARAAGAG